MIDFLATYLFIGMIFVFCMEWATSHARKKGIPVPPKADFDNEMKLIAIDCVADPSFPKAFVNGILDAVYNKIYKK